MGASYLILNDSTPTGEGATPGSILAKEGFASSGQSSSGDIEGDFVLALF